MSRHIRTLAAGLSIALTLSAPAAWAAVAVSARVTQALANSRRFEIRFIKDPLFPRRGAARPARLELKCWSLSPATTGGASSHVYT